MANTSARLRSTSPGSLFAVILLVAVWSAGLGIVAPVPPAAAYDICSDDGAPCTHEVMTLRALDLYRTGSTTLLTQEIVDNWSSIQAGVGDPDEEDAVYGNSGLQGALTTITHFFDPDNDVNEPMKFQSGPYDDDYPNAWNAARTFWSRALGEYAAGDLAQAYRYLGSVAHFLGDQTIPTHAHSDTHGPDWLDDDAYEEWMSNVGPPGSTSPNAEITSAEYNLLVSEGILDPLPADPNASIDDQLLWLFLNINQTADYFASDDVNGDTVHPSDPLVAGWAQGSIDRAAAMCATRDCPTVTAQLADNDGFWFGANNNNDFDGQLSVIREVSYLYGIRGIGALFALWEEAIARPIVTLSVHRMSEAGNNTAFGTLGMDDLESPDLYAGVVMGANDGLCVSSCPPHIGAYLHLRNGGDRLIDGNLFPSMVTRYDAYNKNEAETSVYPDYHFGRVYPAAAGDFYAPGTDSVVIDLSIWDQDDDITTALAPYSVDDSGALAHGGGPLPIGVDLAKCQSGANDAISFGIYTASCAADPNVTGAAGVPGGYIATGLHGSNSSRAVHAEWSISITDGSLCQQEDIYEQNDSLATATELPVPGTRDAYTCDGDDDWYSLPVEAGQTVTADALFVDADGDIDITLYDPWGSPLISGTSATDNESVSAVAAATGRHYVRVYGYNSAANYYTVAMSKTLCPSSDGGNEPNGTTAQATPISNLDQVSATICDASGSDHDFYSFHANAGDVVDIELEFEHDDGDLDMEVCVPACEFRISTDDNEDFHNVATTTGTHYVRVFTQHDVDTAYSLSLETAPCTREDGYEDNDTQATATPIGNRATISATACDDDWYSFEVTQPHFTVLDASGAYSPLTGDVEMELYDSSGSLLSGFSDQAPGDKGLTRQLSPGTYAIRVAGENGEKPPYTLDVNFGVCPYDDDTEENDTQATAFPLASSTFAASCDIDFYSVPIVAGDYLTAELDFVHDDGDVNVYLLDPAGNAVASSLSATDDECVTHLALQTGDYAIAVMGDANLYEVSRFTPATPVRTANDEASLNYAIACFNAAPAGSYVIDITGDIDLTGSIVPIDNPNGASLRINGGGYTIDGNASSTDTRECAIATPPYTAPCDGDSSTAGFHVTAGDFVTIDNIRIANTRRGLPGGGALLNEGNTDVSNSEFDSNGTVGGGGSSDGGNGGAINNSGTLSLLDTKILRNTCFWPDGGYCRGGGLYNSGTLSVTGGEITQNGGGSSLTLGAGLYSNNFAVIANTRITANTGDRGGGAAFANSAIIVASDISDNTAFIDGGGIYSSGDVLIDASSLVGNEAVEDGGGIYNVGGAATLVNSTLSGNRAATGGGIYNFLGSVDASFTTIVDNDSAVGAGILSENTGGELVEVAASIVADNTGGGVDVGIVSGTTDPFASGGYSVIGSVDASVAAFTQPGDITNQSNVGALPLEAGVLNPSLVHPIDTTSLAYDRVFGVVTTGTDEIRDVRGTVRPAGAKDSGAYEFECVDDLYEDNDSILAAAVLVNDVAVNGAVCPIDDDWYSIPVVSGQLVTAVVDFVHADGDLDITLFDPAGAQVDLSNSVLDREAITWTAAASGSYALRVYGYNGATNTYSVSMKAGNHPLIRPFGGLANPEGDTGSQILDLYAYLEDEFGDPYVSPTPVTISWTTLDIPSNPLVAHPGEDFVASSGTITFAPGESITTVPIEILGDTVDEPPLLYGEWGLWNVSGPSTNAKIDFATFFGAGLFIIIDDD